MKKALLLAVLFGLFGAVVGCDDKGKGKPITAAEKGQAGTAGMPTPPPLIPGGPPKPP